MMVIEPIKPVDDWTIDDWRDAFDTLNELYSRELKRAERAESGLTNVREKASVAMAALTDYYNVFVGEVTAELTEKNAALLKRVRQLETVNAALAAQRGGEGE